MEQSEQSEELIDAILPSHTMRKGKVREIDPKLRRVAVRTAFVARFIVLREGRRSRAHRFIEQLCWESDSTAQDLAKQFLDAFIKNGDKLQPVQRDLKRALVHGERSVDYFANQYVERATASFQDALIDYVRSNQLLFGDDPKTTPRHGGWRLPHG